MRQHFSRTNSLCWPPPKPRKAFMPPMLLRGGRLLVAFRYAFAAAVADAAAGPAAAGADIPMG